MKIKNGTLINGDYLEIMKTIPDQSIDLICTDPPYRTISGGKNSKAVAGWPTSVLRENDGKIFKHNNIKMEDYFKQCYRVLKNSGHFYAMINNLNLKDMLNCASDTGFGFHNLLRWDKNTHTANRWYMKDCEYTCLFYKKPSRTINKKSSRQGFFAKNIRNKKHPTQKPVELFEHYIMNSSDFGEIVLDPFSGSGTTAIAAENLNRRWICIEKDPIYYWGSVARIIGDE